MPQTTARQRGRPRQYDEMVVKQAILDCFWEKGYSATSVDDLCRATGLVRPSLYGAFGKKKDMFIQAMDLFTEQSYKLLLRATESPGRLEDKLRAIYEVMILRYTGADINGNKGCIVFTAAATDAPAHAEIRNYLSRGIKCLDSEFLRLLQTLAPQAPDALLRTISQLASATLHSLGLRARAGTPGSDLRDFAWRSGDTLAAMLAPYEQAPAN